METYIPRPSVKKLGHKVKQTSGDFEDVPSFDRSSSELRDINVSGAENNGALCFLYALRSSPPH